MARNEDGEVVTVSEKMAAQSNGSVEGGVSSGVEVEKDNTIDIVIENMNVTMINGHAPPTGCKVELDTSVDDAETRTCARLEWSDINVSTKPTTPTCRERIKRCFCNKKVFDDQQSMTILKNVSGVAEPGSLLAIMGSSGAGKTTLMNVLSKHNIAGVSVKGTVLVNNRNISNKIKTLSAYVLQEDLFVGTLTVKEHLTFQALLRMGSSYSRKEKLQRVTDVITQLGLVKCQNTMIGITGRIPGISGGELKRLSFASEIITNPTLLFVDEPTSGLDSYMAESAVLALQKLAGEGKTILATIHQPSSEVFQLFDRLLLLSNGRTAFLGTTKEAEVFFSETGHPCPLNFNPADHYIRTLAIIPGRDEECKNKSNLICDTYESGKYAYRRGSYQNKTDDMDDIYLQQTYKEDAFTQYRSLLWRSSKACQREPYVNTLRMMQTIAVSLVCGLAFLNQNNDQDGTRNIHGALFFISINLTIANALSVIFVFPAELPIFLKENRNGMYRLDIYFMARTLAELPWYVLSTFIYATITYWMIGLRKDSASYFIFVGVCQLIVQCSVSYGLIISSLAPTTQVALSVAAPMILPLVLFGGFFMTDGSVPIYFIWVKFISWIKYSFEVLEVNQWKGFGVIHCNENSSRCISDGQSVLESLNYEDVDFNRNIACLLALIVGFRLIAFLIVLARSYRTK